MVLARELMWLMSAATPGVAAISYSDSSLTKGEICADYRGLSAMGNQRGAAGAGAWIPSSGMSTFISNPRGCPIPPAAPRIATLRSGNPVAADANRLAS